MRQYQLLLLGFGWTICVGCSGDTGMTPSQGNDGTIPNDSQPVPNDSQTVPNSDQSVPNDSQPPPNGGQVSGPGSVSGTVDCDQLCVRLVAGNCLSDEECQATCVQDADPSSECYPELSVFADCVTNSTIVCEQTYDFVNNGSPCFEQVTAYNNCAVGADSEPSDSVAQCTVDDGCLGCADACEACLCGMQVMDQDTRACDTYCNG